MVLLLLPLPLILWPVFGIAASFLGGVGYGFFAPLLATFEAVEENVRNKFYHCFAVSFSLLSTCLSLFITKHIKNLPCLGWLAM